MTHNLVTRPGAPTLPAPDLIPTEQSSPSPAPEARGQEPPREIGEYRDDGDRNRGDQKVLIPDRRDATGHDRDQQEPQGSDQEQSVPPTGAKPTVLGGGHPCIPEVDPWRWRLSRFGSRVETPPGRRLSACPESSTATNAFRGGTRVDIDRSGDAVRARNWHGGGSNGEAIAGRWSLDLKSGSVASQVRIVKGCRTGRKRGVSSEQHALTVLAAFAYSFAIGIRPMRNPGASDSVDAWLGKIVFRRIEVETVNRSSQEATISLFHRRQVKKAIEDVGGGAKNERRVRAVPTAQRVERRAFSRCKGKSTPDTQGTQERHHVS